MVPSFILGPSAAFTAQILFENSGKSQGCSLVEQLLPGKHKILSSIFVRNKTKQSPWGTEGLRESIQKTSGWRGWGCIWLRPHHHGQPLKLDSGTAWLSLSVHYIVPIRCSQMHDDAESTEASQTQRPCLLGTQNLKAPEVSRFCSRHWLSHGASLPRGLTSTSSHP